MPLLDLDIETCWTWYKTALGLAECERDDFAVVVVILAKARPEGTATLSWRWNRGAVEYARKDSEEDGENADA